MGTKAALTVEEYLQTSFPDLDREYWGGELVERSVPDDPPSKTQVLVLQFFGARRKELLLFPRAELRLILGPSLVLIPDVCVFHPAAPVDRFPKTPPLIVVEILSPDDRQSEVREKLEKYRTWGVPHVWLLDPNSRRTYQCAPGLLEVPTLSVPELGLELAPTDAFDE